MGKRIRYPKRESGSKVHQFKVGESIVVKAGVTDPDHGNDLGGWQGRVTELITDEDGSQLIGLAWDSQTLRQIPGEVIERSEEDGLDWSTMMLYTSEVEPARPRDKPRDVGRAKDEISAQYSWAYMGEQGKRIQEALGDADGGDEMEAFEAWAEYLEHRLVFPFEAEVSEWQEHGPLQSGDQVELLEIRQVVGLYGILVDIRAGGERYVFPLCDLEATDEASKNYQPVDDYAVWFANR